MKINRKKEKNNLMLIKLRKRIDRNFPAEQDLPSNQQKETTQSQQQTCTENNVSIYLSEIEEDSQPKNSFNQSKLLSNHQESIITQQNNTSRSY